MIQYHSLYKKIMDKNNLKKNIFPLSLEQELHYN